jgi:hypothetical protein
MNTKVLLGILVTVIAAYLAWRWIAAAPSQPGVAHAPTKRSAPTQPAAATRLTPAKAPLAQQHGARPTSPRPVVAKQPRLAPEGTYFLLQRTSLKLDTGVVGFAPGTKVTLVDKDDSMSTVSDGQYQFTVPSFQLTNDLDIAENVAKSDYAAQTHIAESIGKSVRQYEQQRRDALAASEKEKAQKKTGKRPAARSPTPR